MIQKQQISMENYKRICNVYIYNADCVFGYTGWTVNDILVDPYSTALKGYGFMGTSSHVWIDQNKKGMDQPRCH